MTTNLAQYLKNHPELHLGDVAYTLQVGRKEFNHRRIVVCRTREEAIDALETLDPWRVGNGCPEDGRKPVVFIFQGRLLQEQDVTYLYSGNGFCTIKWRLVQKY